MVASLTGPVMAIRAGVGYATAKAGMVGLTRAAAVDAAGHGIIVNAVAQGWIWLTAAAGITALMPSRAFFA